MYYWKLILFSFVAISCSKDEDEEIDPGDNEPALKGYEVNVSQSAATITVPDVMTITIPKGAFQGTATFQVTPVQSSSLPAAENFTMFETFEITSTSGTTFASDLEIVIKYDSSKGEKGAGLNGAAYYNEGLKKWIPFTDVTVDEQKSEVRLKSNHLTKLGRFSITRALGYTDWLSSSHFNIYWKENAVPSNTQYVSPYKDVNVGTDPHYVQDIKYYLETAFSAYQKANLTLPNGRINVYLKKLDAGADGMTSFFGYICINESIQNSNYASTAEVLPMVCAHELLHYVQDYYYMQLFSDYTIKWWLEATAVQADRFVWPTNKKFEVLEYAQTLYENLAVSWDNSKSDPAWYIAGNFLTYLITYRSGAKLALPDLITEGGKATNVSYMRTILDNLIKSKLGSSVGEEYVKFVRWAVEGKSDVKLSPQPPTPTPVYSNFKNAILALRYQKESLNANIPYLSTAFFKGMNNVGEKLSMVAKVDTKSDFITAYAFKMKSGSATFIREMTKNDSIEVELANNTEWVEVICMNKSKDENGSAKVIFRFNNQPKITSISPQKAKAGDQVSVNGTNLGTGTSSSIYINNQVLNLTKYLKSWTNTLIQFTVPEDASSGDIYVKVNDVPSNKVAFEFLKDRPVIEMWGVRNESKYISGTYNPWGPRRTGSTITILGKNWIADPAKTKVKINGTAVPGNFNYEVDAPYSRKIVIDMPANVSGNISLTVESEGQESDPKTFFVGIPVSALQKLPVFLIENTMKVSYQNGGTNSFSFQLTTDSYVLSTTWSGNTLKIIGDVGGWVGRHEMTYTFSEDGTKATLQGKITSINLDLTFTIKDIPFEFGYYGRLDYDRENLTGSDYTSVSGNVKTSSPVYVYPVTGVVSGSTGLSLKYKY